MGLPTDAPPIPPPPTLGVQGVNTPVSSAPNGMEPGQGETGPALQSPPPDPVDQTIGLIATKGVNAVLGDLPGANTNEGPDLLMVAQQKAQAAAIHSQVLAAAGANGYDVQSKSFLDDQGDKVAPTPDQRQQLLALNLLDSYQNSLDDAATAIKNQGTLNPAYRTVQNSATSAINAYLAREGQKTAEITRQLDDYIKRAKATYDLQDSEQNYSINADNQNMKATKWQMDTGQVGPMGTYYTAPPPNRMLSSALRASIPDTVAPDYMGMAQALGFGSYADGTPVTPATPLQPPQPDVSAAVPASPVGAPQAGVTNLTGSFASPPSAPVGGQIQSATPITTPSTPAQAELNAPPAPDQATAPAPVAPKPAISNTPVTSPFNSTKSGRLSALAGGGASAAFIRVQARPFIDASVQANMQNKNPAASNGVPNSGQPVRIGNSVIPPDVVRRIGAGFPVDRPDANFRWLRAGESF